MSTAIKDGSGTTNSEEADLDGDSIVRWGLWKVRQAAGALPPLSALSTLVLPSSGSLDLGWWIRRRTDPYTSYDHKWVHLTGSIGTKPAGATYVTRYEWVWDAGSASWVMNYISYWGYPIATWLVFVDPSSCASPCFPDLYGSDRTAAVNTTTEAWSFVSTASGLPGTNVSVPCGVSPTRINASSCYQRVLTSAEMDTLLQPDSYQDYSNQSTSASSDWIVSYSESNAQSVLDNEPETQEWLNAYLEPEWYPGASPASPVPMSPSGSVTSGYSTSLLAGDAIGTDDGLRVVSSTAAGTIAVTGAVIDDSTGDPVSGASVTLSCSAACSMSPVSTTTDSQGAFAFINIPANTLDLDVKASGYGTYSVINDPYTADTTSQITVFLRSGSYTIDMADGAGTTEHATATPRLPGTDYSSTRVPPSIRVRMNNTYGRSGPGTFCAMIGQPTSTVRSWSFRFYLLHVVKPEVEILNYNEKAMKAYMALAQNFAWVAKTLGGPADVDNSTNTQCFRPEERITNKNWNKWAPDVLNERVIDDQNRLRETPYEAGTPNVCTDPSFPAGGGKASQNGLKTHSSDANGCNVGTGSNWRPLAVYYYLSGWDVVAGLAPPPPEASYSLSGGQITLQFVSTEFEINVAWRYYLQHREKGTKRWKTFAVKRWRQSSRTVETSHAFTPEDPSKCMEYRVKAINPVNWSATGIDKAGATRFTPTGVGLKPSGTC